MTKHKVEFVVATKDGDEEGLRSFSSQLQHFVDDNVPANSGWAKVKDPKIEVRTEEQELEESLPWTHRKSKWADDKRWKAILDKVDEMAKKFPRSMRGPAMETEGSGAAKPVVYCKAVFYDDKTCTQKSMYLISAHENTVKFRGPLGAIIVEVDGPYEDAADDYWQARAEFDKTRAAVITADWVHQTVYLDRTSDSDLAGFGGAEFRFDLLTLETVSRFKEFGLKIESTQMRGGATDAYTIYTLVSHNVMWQGVIPAKHRHLFKVNAKKRNGPAPLVQPV